MLRSRVTFSGLAGGPAVSTMYWNTSSVQAGADAVSSALQTFWGAIDGEMVGVTTAIETEVAIVDPLTGLQTGTLQVSPWSLTSGGSGERLPHAVQALIRWRTGVYVNGKEIRGRTFVPAIPEVDSSNGSLLSGIQTVMTQAAQALADSEANLGVYSSTHRRIEPVTTAQVWSQFAYLRSRRD